MDWMDWTFSPPPNALIIMKTPSGISILRPSELHPESNVGNAQWKLTGIGWEELGWDWKPTRCWQQQSQSLSSMAGMLGGLLGPSAELGFSQLSPEERAYWSSIN